MSGAQDNPDVTAALPTREAVRVLLIHEDKLLLMKVVLPDRTLWCTIGGGMDKGESLDEAVKRETWEEVGLTDQDVTWSKAVWHGEHVIERYGIDMLHRETFVVGYARNAVINSGGLTAEEKEVVKEFKWWTLAELDSTEEFIVPPSMIEHIKPILRGEIPAMPIKIDLADKPR